MLPHFLLRDASHSANAPPGKISRPRLKKIPILHRRMAEPTRGRGQTASCFESVRFVPQVFHRVLWGQRPRCHHPREHCGDQRMPAQCTYQHNENKLCAQDMKQWCADIADDADKTTPACSAANADRNPTKQRIPAAKPTNMLNPCFTANFCLGLAGPRGGGGMVLSPIVILVLH